MSENFEEQIYNNQSEDQDGKTIEKTRRQISPQLGYTAVGVAVLFLFLFVLINLLKPAADTTSQSVPLVNEVPLITAEEVAMERFSLKTDATFDVPTSGTSNDPNQATETDVTELEEAREATFEEAVEAAEMAAPPLPIGEEPIIESSKPGFGFTGDVTVTNTAITNQPTVSRTLEGTVFSVDIEQSLIVLTTPDGSYLVHVNSNTDLIINSKKFAFADLKTLDIVSVSGKGAATAHEILADRIEVTDVLEINASIN